MFSSPPPTAVVSSSTNLVGPPPLRSSHRRITSMPVRRHPALSSDSFFAHRKAHMREAIRSVHPAMVPFKEAGSGEGGHQGGQIRWRRASGHPVTIAAAPLLPALPPSKLGAVLLCCTHLNLLGGWIHRHRSVPVLLTSLPPSLYSTQRRHGQVAPISIRSDRRSCTCA